MINARVDQETLIRLFSEATSWQAEALSQAVCEATQQALQGRASALANMRKATMPVAQAPSSDAAQRRRAEADFEALQSTVFAGMDAALLQSVQANGRGLRQFVDQGAAPQESRMKGALADVEKIEKVFLATVIQTSTSRRGPATSAVGAGARCDAAHRHRR